MLFLLGGLVQINPIWLWGPYETALGTNGAQPDWYLGWLIGALRLVPGFDVTIGNYTVIPNPFWGGALFPLVVLVVLAAVAVAERRITGDRARPQRARPPARRAAAHRVRRRRSSPGSFLIFFAGSSDRLFVFLGIPYTTQIWFWRFGVWIFPALTGVIAYRTCKSLQAGELVQADQQAAEAEARQGAPPPVPAGEP